MLFCCYDLFDRGIKEAYNVSTNIGPIKDGSLATMKINPLGKTLSFSYDSLKHLDKVAVPGVYAREYDYKTLSGNRSSNLVSRVDYTQNGSTYFSRLYYDYTYDEAGNITTIKQNGSQIAKYGYDKQGQLLTETRGGTTYRYVYDTAGNILEVIPSGLPASESYTYGDGTWKDLLTSIKIGGTTKSISYDASGNPTNWYNGNTLTGLTWSKGRQLTSLTKNTSTAISYTYDMSGIRSSKKVGSDTYHFITQNGQVVRQTWGSNILDIVYDNNGQPFAMCYSTNGGSTFTDYYYITNVQGDVVRLVNSAGTTVANYTYDAWGKVLNVTSASGTTITDANNIANINPIRYRGYYYDTETGWYYLQSRYYDPEIGRFINADLPEYSAISTIGDNNLFAYCGNNPVSRTDPSGEIFFTLLSGAIGGAVNALYAYFSGEGDPAESFRNGFISGAIAGLGVDFGLAAIYSFGTSMLFSAGIAGVAGVASGIVGTALAPGEASGVEYIGNALVGGLFNMISFGTAPINGEIAKGTFLTVMKDVACHSAKEFGENLLSGTVTALGGFLASKSYETASAVVQSNTNTRRNGRSSRGSTNRAPTPKSAAPRGSANRGRRR